MEPLGETKTTLPPCNPHGRTVPEVPHLTPQKHGNERLPVKQIPVLLTLLCLAYLEVSEQWVILHTLLLCCRTVRLQPSQPELRAAIPLTTLVFLPCDAFPLMVI